MTINTHVHRLESKSVECRTSPILQSSTSSRSSHLFFLGAWYDQLDLLISLLQTQYVTTFLPTIDYLIETPCPPGSLIIVEINTTTQLNTIALLTQQYQIPWLAWNRYDHASLTIAAYEAGAYAVLPSTLTIPILQQTIQNIANNISRPHRTKRYQRLYRQNEYIFLDEHMILEVKQGIVAITVLNEDGTQILLGLCGTGQMLFGHPEDSCCIQIIAHTDASIVFYPWQEAMTKPNVIMQLRSRLRLMEAWASVQAQPYLDQRLLGILTLLAEQFGIPHDQGVLIDVRITHAQLAITLGATRTTITRLLGNLRRQGILISVGTGSSERFCLSTSPFKTNHQTDK